MQDICYWRVKEGWKDRESEGNTVALPNVHFSRSGGDAVCILQFPTDSSDISYGVLND